MTKEEAIKTLRELLRETNDHWYEETYNMAIESLEQMPSAERHGRWIKFDDAYNRISGRCSVCGWESHLYEDDVVGMPYCPNCGTRMDGE